MGWISSLVSVTSAASLWQMQQNQAESEEAQALLASMRQHVFELKQMASQAIEEESLNRKIAAFHMRLLANRLKTTWITPDLFPQTSDKEYAANVYQTIHKQSDRIFKELSSAEQREVKQAESAFLEYASATTYLDHIEEAQKVRQAQDTVNALEGRNKTFLPLTFLLLYVLIGMVVLVMLFANPGTTPCVVGVIAVIGLAVFQNFYVRRGAYNTAKKTLDETTLNMEKFSELEKKYSSIEQAQERQMNAEAILAQFQENNHISDDDLILVSQDPESLPQRMVSDMGDDRAVNSKPVSTDASGEENGEYVYECAACGRQVKEDMQFCPYCGEKFE